MKDPVAVEATVIGAAIFTGVILLTILMVWGYDRRRQQRGRHHER